MRRSKNKNGTILAASAAALFAIGALPADANSDLSAQSETLSGVAEPSLTSTDQSSGMIALPEVNGASPSQVEIFGAAFFRAGPQGEKVAQALGLDSLEIDKHSASSIAMVADEVQKADPELLQQLEENAKSNDLVGTREAIVAIDEEMKHLGEMQATEHSTMSLVTPTVWSVVLFWSWNSFDTPTNLQANDPKTDTALDRTALTLVEEYSN